MSTQITAQELFDQVVTAVVKQGRKSEGTDGRCMYRHPDGLKCAAGHAMTDEEFEEFGGMERNDAWFGGDRVPPRLKPYQHLLNALQSDHDSANNGDFARDFLRHAEDTARDFKLTMPEVSQ